MVLTLRSLVGRVIRRVRPAGVRGAVDGLSLAALSGWAAAGAAPVVVELRHGEATVAQAPAGLARPDVAATGLAPAACGFSFGLDEVVAGLAELGSGEARPLRVFASGVELPGATPPLSRSDLIDAMALDWAVRRLAVA